MPKKILLVFHLNFLKNDMGCSSYVYNIVKYLKSQGCSIDFFSTNRINNNFENFEEINQREKLIDNFYFYGADKKAKTRQKLGFGFSKRVKFSLSKYYFLGVPVLKIRNKKASLVSWVDKNLLGFYQEVVNKNNYDFINIHYIQFADLIKFSKIPSNTKTIYTMHDANFMQEFYRHQSADIGFTIKDEINQIGLFDRVMAISNDEKSFFEKFFSNKPFYHIPHLLKKIELPKVKKEIDVLFLGFSNQYNRDGVIWFVDKVMPHLPNNLNITVCGKVWLLIEKERPKYIEKMQKLGVNRIDFAPDLDELYAKTKVSIAPMFDGTGMKIKTIDSMARGIPVVSTTLGVDGFADKNENGCLVSDNPAEFAVNIRKLLEDDKFYQEMVEKNNYYFDTYLSLEVNSKTLDEVFELTERGEL